MWPHSRFLFGILASSVVFVSALYYYKIQKKKEKSVISYDEKWPVSVRIAEVVIYPIKSCKGISLQRAKLTKYGLEYDRNWMVVYAENGVFITQRKHPRLALVEPSFKDNMLLLNAPNMPQLKISLKNEYSQEIEVKVWSSTCVALDEGSSAAEWFSKYLGVATKLVRMTSSFVRPTDKRYWTDEFPGSKMVSFADGYPFLAISRESLAHLNEKIRGEEPLKMNRFRPNFVTFGTSNFQPFEEDSWRSVKINSTIFHGVKKCSRCKLTTVKPEEGVFSENNEPLATLQKLRNQDGQVYFGQNLVHESFDGEVCVGDVVEVLERWGPEGCPPLPKNA